MNAHDIVFPFDNIEKDVSTVNAHVECLQTSTSADGRVRKVSVGLCNTVQGQCEFS